MRIGIFTDTYPPYINGVSTSIKMLEQALRKKGHQVFIVTVNPEDMKFKYEENGRIIRIPGIPTGIYDYRLTGIYPIRVLKKIKKWNLDVIHSHTEFGVGTFARLVAKQYDIPLVHTYHTMYEDYVHYITHGYFNKSSKKLAEYFTKFYCDKTATELIVPSKKTYDLFKDKYKVNRNVHIVATGIDVERFYRENLNQKKLADLKNSLGIKDEKVISFIGRLAKEKSVEVLLESQAYLSKKYNVKLLIVGSGPDLDHFKQMVKKLKIQDNVIFTGAVPWEEIPYYYAISDIFATASTTETQGLTVIEAMASGLPVVCADDESFRDVVIDDLNGYLFKNKKQYRKCMEDILNNPEKLKQMSGQARITADSHSLKYYAEQILDVYRCALQTKKKKSILEKIKDYIGIE
jgi:1,2-diacylglycerol 3-alpha-glucosyltransferase